MNNIIDFLISENINYTEHESMKKYTTFKIGGDADLFVLPKNIQEASSVIKYFFRNKIEYFILGNGSNLLVSDSGIKSPVIKTNQLDFIEQTGTELYVGAGCLNVKIANYALKQSLSGFEFCHGIPGSLGGAVFMNAGAYGEDIGGICEKTIYVDNEGNIRALTGKDQGFGYRESVFSEGELICGAVLKLKHGEPSEIKAKMYELMERRRTSQPLEYPSAGSVFKRPAGYYTGKLIDDCGLKGFQIGGAQVSMKHSGFIINVDNATENDVRTLIKHIQKTVYGKYGVELKTEIRGV